MQKDFFGAKRLLLSKSIVISGKWAEFFSAKTAMPHREGFALAGAWLIEREKTVSQFPAEGQSARILAERERVGGETFNLAKRLRERAADLPLYAIGCIGDDEDGHAVLAACHELDIDTYQLHALAGAPTGHVEIFISNDKPSRTLFYYAGANGALDLEHFDFRHCLARWFHLGDVELLARLARRDEACGVTGGRVLQAARAHGLATSLAWPAGERDVEEGTRNKIFAQTDHLIPAPEAPTLWQHYLRTLAER